MSDAAHIFHLSDLHFGAEDQAALDWAARAIAEANPHAVAITGDLTMRARHREFAAAADWISNLGAPATLALGNHDVPYFNLSARLFRPYRRFHRLARSVASEVALPGLAIVPLKTAVRAQPRLNWSKGWVSARALRECLATLDALPPGTKALVSAHHPLREVGTHGTALTVNGGRALAELARRPVLAVLSGHVHDPFDMMEDTANGPVRMIGAGTLSERVRTTPPSFNELLWDGERLKVEVRELG